MKRRLSLAAVALFAMVSFASLNAKDPDPYQSKLESGNYTTFNPTGNFSLQAKLAIGESIEARNASGKGFVYKAAKPGVYSFLVDIASGEVKVYWGGALQNETVTVTTSMAPISLGGEDLVGSELQDPTMKSGIYKATNLLKNPGFETISSYCTNYDPTVDPTKTDQRAQAADWYVLSNFYTGNGDCRSNNIQTNTGYELLRGVAEGKWAFMLHGSNTPLWQQLDKSKLASATWYKVSYRQMAHGDTSSPTAYASYILTDSVNVDVEGQKNVVASHSYTSAPQGLGNYVDVTYGFKTPDVLSAGDLYFVIRRTGAGCINHFDRMTLQKLTEGDVHLNGVVTKVGEISWQEGLSAPTGGSEEVYEDVTAKYMVNPSFEDKNVTQAAHSHSGPNNGVWIPAGWAGDNSVIDTDGWTQGLVTSGKQGDGKSDSGFLPADGNNFYFFRCRWRADTFTLGQTLKTLPAGRYDLTFSAAVDPKVPGSFSLTGAVDKVQELTTSVLTTYSIPFNVINPGDVNLQVSVSRVNQEAPALLVVDNFKLIYRGGASEQDVILELQDALRSLGEQLDLYSPDKLTNGVLVDMQAAVEKADIAESDPTLENLQAAVDAYKDLIAKAKECGDMFDELSNACVQAVTDMKEHPDYSGNADYEKVFQEATPLLDQSTNNPEKLYYASDLKAAIEALKAARRVFFLSASDLATETDPVDFTNIVSSPNFTKEGGDASLAADRVQGEWKTANVPVTSGQYKLHTVNGRNCWNNWENNFTSMDVYQEMKGMPEGMYSLKCVTTTNGVPHDQHAYITTVAGTTVSPAATYQYTGTAFDAESQWEPLSTEKVYLPKGATLRIGFASTGGGGTSGWFCVTGFELSYYKASADAAMKALNVKVANAKELLDTASVKIMGVEKAILNTAVSNAEKATVETILASYTEMDGAIDTAMVSVRNYNALYPVMEEAEVAVNKNDYTAEAKAALTKVIADQNALLVDASTSAADLPIAKNALRKAIDIFLYSNIVIPNDVSSENPYDLTDKLLKDPSLDPTLTTADNVIPAGWNINKGSGDAYTKANSQHYTGDATNRYIDSYNSAAGSMKYTAYQTINGLPNGKYRLECVSRSSSVGAYLYAIGSDLMTSEMVNYGSEGGPIWEAAEEGSSIKLVNTGKGFGWQKMMVDNINVNDNTLTVGVTTDVAVSHGTVWNGTWFSADEFKLYCVSKDFNPLGVEEVGADNATLNVYVENGYVKVEGIENFTIIALSGTPVSANTQLAPGFYIVTAEGQSVKVAVK